VIHTAQENIRMPDPTRDSTGVNSPEEAERQNRFVQDNLRRVFLIIYRIVGNVADAQDLTQEAFIKALQRGDQLKDTQKAAQWLSRIAHNTAIDFLRRHGRVNFTEIDALVDPLRVPAERNPESQLLRGEQQKYLEDGLRLLTVKERTALLLRDVEDLPAEQVAQHLGCSMATVRSHIANARIKFKRYMERRRA
jgi:RNA polymerase sigma-70 factor (ECF subfamily)